MDSRHFENDLDDFDSVSNSTLISLGPNQRYKAEETFINTLKCKRVELLSLLEAQNLQTQMHDGSVYVGHGGIAFLYWHLYRFSDENEEKIHYLNKAKLFVDLALRDVRRLRGPAFLLGKSGPVALAAIIAKCQNKIEECQHYVSSLLSLLPSALDASTPDELLYGRVGYLYALLLLQKHVLPVPQGHLATLAKCVIQSGQLEIGDKFGFPLMWYFHEKAYLGPAHGVAGILDLLLEVRHLLSADELNLIKVCVDRLVDKCQMESGNFDSSLPLKRDKLVHWCHGAPGVIHLIVKAAQIFPENRQTYVKSALKCGEVIWRRGLLKKGYGLCHGAPGNAYGLFSLFKLTNDPKWLHRGLQFAFWCLNWGRHGCQIPDDPLSLMNGLAGTIVFLLDVENERAHIFPCYHID